MHKYIINYICDGTSVCRVYYADSRENALSAFSLEAEYNDVKANITSVFKVPDSVSGALVEAVERIKDMLKDDDGQAFKEARKFLDKIYAND